MGVQEIAIVGGAVVVLVVVTIAMNWFKGKGGGKGST